MPKGATVVEENGKELNDANEGIVIKDEKGNEWVWIEVPKSVMPEGLTFVDEANYSADDEEMCNSIIEKLKTYVAGYRQDKYTDEWYAIRGTETIVLENTASSEEKQFDNGCGLTLNKYKEIYQKMIKSVYKNGGFWIGRYEAGIEGSTGIDSTSLVLGRTKNNKGEPTKEAICQKDAIPYNYVSASQAQKLASQMTPDSTKISSLMFGIQWDLVCKYLEIKSVLNEEDITTDSGSWGIYWDSITIDSEHAKQCPAKKDEWEITSGIKDDNNILLSTGAWDATCVLNIYDFAGNAGEWTLEFSGDFSRPHTWRRRVFR